MGTHQPDLSDLTLSELGTLRMKSIHPNRKEVGSFPWELGYSHQGPWTHLGYLRAHPLHGLLSVRLGMGLSMPWFHIPSEGKGENSIISSGARNQGIH